MFMKKKLLVSIICFITIITLVFAGCTRLEQKPTVFMWEVMAKEGTGKLYLLGSIHVGKSDLYPLNQVINDAYESSDVLAVEIDLTTALQNANLSELMEKMMYTDGTTLKDHISPELYEKTSAVMEKYGIIPLIYDKMKPFALSSTILDFQVQEWGYSNEYGIDMYFLTRAHEEGKKIVEIESMEFQYDMLSGFSDENQELMLKSSLEDETMGKEEMDKLFSIWAAGDVAALEALYATEDDNLAEEELVFYAEYSKAMFDDRNIHMAQKAEEYLAEGHTTFYVVGAAHMIGDTGIVKLLKDKGYKVRQK